MLDMLCKTTAVLALVAVVGCGGPESDDTASAEKLETPPTTTTAPDQREPFKSWNVSITTAGGFTGHGAGGVSATSAGTIGTSGFLGMPTPCPDVTFPEESARINAAIEAGDPDEWTASYAHASNPEGCCDQYRYTLKLEIERQDGTTRDFTTKWYDDSKANLPPDLRALTEALWAAKQKVAAKCDQ
jgi:hypothetical protein